MFAFHQPVILKKGGNDILAVGELLVDLISTEYGEENATDEYRRFFGGSPANIAMNCRHLGIRSALACAVGQDGMGKFLLEHLKNAGMDVSLVQCSDSATSMVVVNRCKGTPTPIFYRGADHELTFTPTLAEAIRDSRIVHFSCWPVSRQPSRNTMEAVLAEARDAGLLIGFDPNYHPLVWERGEDGVSYVKTLIGKAAIVKPSEDDAERLFGRDTHENQLEKFLTLGAKLVVMTLGKDGILASNGTETIQLESLATEVVDTTGAGDAFWSGLYTAVIQGLTLREALMSGLAVSAVKLRHVGAVVGLPPMETIRMQFPF